MMPIAAGCRYGQISHYATGYMIRRQVISALQMIIDILITID